jgi:4-hydroxy-tetrahydrodipicolinate reductase
MGRSVLELAGCDDRFEVVAALTKPGCSLSGTDLRLGDRRVQVTETLEAACDVLIDFTVAEGTMTCLAMCTKRGIPMVIGATGHDDRQLSRIREAAGTIPILRASNFSIGVQVMLDTVGRLAKKLGEGYDVEIVEAHHRHKVDAPSGTALTLTQEIAEARGLSPDKDVVYGRHGQTGERPVGEIGVHAVRMGDIISQHEVHFSGPGETLTLRHTAHSRDTFAAGALRAAAWIVDKRPAFYTIHDVMR